MWGVNILNSLSTNWAIGFPEPATNRMVALVELHNMIVCYLILIMIVLLWCFSYAVYTGKKRMSTMSYKSYLKYINIYGFENCFLLELIWTAVPAVTLVSAAFPSLAVLYSLNEHIVPGLTIKVIGQQWFWTYEYGDCFSKDLHVFTRLSFFVKEERPNWTMLRSTRIAHAYLKDNRFKFDSVMLKKEDIDPETQQLYLDVDNPAFIPVDIDIKVLVTSSDVVHSWAVPAFGIKVDACPGRLNQLTFRVFKEGSFYGQCSELCGVGHGFMPISIKVVKMEAFKEWVSERYKEKLGARGSFKGIYKPKKKAN